ncbi:MAG: PQQ-binding-like beta-propeller repeat protein [Chloroflexi bacterium]|nr:PQQ-binding-like beta-propeller repeat protein [Chloroflexota bacterium]MBV9597192.1 PQQ-binding-like beta-propeller repeat protein [Chloroflexota bacterium]
MAFWKRLPFVFALTAALVPGGVSLAQSTPSSSSSSAAAWPRANFDYANTRAVTDSSVTAANLGQLGVAWTFGVSGVGIFGALATVPIVQDGTVYLQDLKDNVYALDFKTGALKWQKQFDVDNIGPNGPAVDSGKVFVQSDAQTVTALDASSGNALWSTQITDAPTEGIDQQLATFNGTLYVSTVPGTGASDFYAGGGAGIIYALDEQTGAVKWSFNTVKDGDLWGNPEVNSGGGAWYSPAIDTSTGTTYWGIGNPAPWPGTTTYPNGSSRPGPNLYTDSDLALNSSGELQWYGQPKPRDLTDGDFEAAPILATVSADGGQRNIVIGAGKNGYVAAFDKQTGEQLWNTAVGVHQNDDLQSFPSAAPVEVFPGDLGGVETPMAFSGGILYVPVVNLSTSYTSTNHSGLQLDSGTGELVAINAATGDIVWDSDLDSMDFGGATVSGDVVFTSTYSGELLAFDRGTGKQVWSWQAPGGINAVPAVVGDTVLLPVGIGGTPELVALRVGASGAAAAQPAATPATPAAAAPAAAPAPGAQGGLQLSVSTPAGTPLAFNTDTLQATPGAQVTVTYTNDSQLPHNWHVYNGTDSSAPSLASTPVGSGPNDVKSVEFNAPTQAGQYYFQCDVHPFMNGHLVVSQSSP